MVNLKAKKLVRIEWQDSVRPTSAWQYLSDMDPPGVVHCVSVGYLLYDGSDIKTLAANLAQVYDEDTAQACGIIHIPACAVKKVTHLRSKN